MPKRHWHVHSHMPGYLCDCDSHYPLSARERDAELRSERDFWRDYAADSPSIRIRGSVRDGGYVVDDTDSIAWERHVDSWECFELDCYEGIEE
jgi:hypothetical protein